MYKATQTLDIKRSNTLSFVITYTDDNGKALSLADFDITAQIKDSSEKLVAVMQSAILNAENGMFELSIPTDAILPLKTLYMDIRLSKDGIERNSDIVQLNVKEVVTDG